MLKSTHRPAPKVAEPVLPPGWTEHKAPSGHSYFYNAETKQSTYTRPQVYTPPPVQTPVPQHNTLPIYNNHANSYPPPNGSYSTGANRAPVADFRSQRHNQPPPQDRPKTKHTIAGCAPWLLVKTRLGRRFVHNPDTKESFWKFPQEVIGGVVEFDIQEVKRKERAERGEPEEEPASEQSIFGEAPVITTTESTDAAPKIVPVATKGYDSEEYEEVEVTDEEDAEDDDLDAEGAPKRRKTDYADEEDGDAEAAAAAALEFTEDDMEAQLAAMGATYNLAPDEYGADDPEAWEDGYDDNGEAGLELTAEEAATSFTDMLHDHAVDPYRPWDAIISNDAASILSDDRYTLLPTSKARREAFSAWSAARIAALRSAREKAAKVDPRVAYLALLDQHASAKLYWPEFKRKFKKDAAMKDAKLADREREKLYREHVGRITKMSERELGRDLEALLESERPGPEWNRRTTLDELPEAVTTDVRYISLRPRLREEVIREFILRLPKPQHVGLDDGEDAAALKKVEEKKREALRERQRNVDDVKRRQQKELQYGRSRLQEEEEHLDRAMKIGKGGLRGQIGGEVGGAQHEQAGDE